MVYESYLFLAVFGFCSGATHKSAALRMSIMEKYLHEGNFPKGFSVAGDDAYLCEDYLRTTFKQEFLGPYTDSF